MTAGGTGTMDWGIIAANVAGVAVMFGGIAMCVRYDQRGKTNRRELEHAERMRAIELGRSLEDTAVARYRALGAVGIAVPIVALSAAAIGSCFAMLFKEEVWRFATLAIIWLMCGGVCLSVLPIVAARFKEAKPTNPRSPNDPAPD